MLNIDPAMFFLGLRRGIARKVITDMLILGGEKTVATVVAAGNVDYQIPFITHHTASARCQVSTPVHFSIWINVVLGLML